MSIHYSKLLLPSKVLRVVRDLATQIGLNEAIVLQQIHYWMDPEMNVGQVFGGQRWIYNTYEQWQSQFPFWTTRTIRRIINNLEDQSLILSTDKLNNDTRDRTKWYTINYEHPILAGGMDKMDTSQTGQNVHLHVDKVATSSIDKEYIQKNTSESNSESDAFDTFYAAYPKKVGKGAARRSFAKAIKSASLDTLLAALESQKQSRQWKENNGQFIPHPATWLNQERWEDEAETAVSVSKAPVITEDDPYQVRAYLGNGPWEIGTDEHGEPIFTSDLRTYYEHKFPEAL